LEDCKRLVFLAQGRVKGGHKGWRKVATQPKPDYLSPPFVAALNATLGEKDEAFAVLERAYEQRNPWLAFLNSPTFDSLRDDPRFAGFCRRIGLPESASI